MKKKCAVVTARSKVTPPVYIEVSEIGTLYPYVGHNSVCFREPSLLTILLLTKLILMVSEEVFPPALRPLSLEILDKSPFFCLR